MKQFDKWFLFLLGMAVVGFLCVQNRFIYVCAETSKTSTGSAMSVPNDTKEEQVETATQGALTIVTMTPTPIIEDIGDSIPSIMLVEETTSNGITWSIDESGVLTLTGTGTVTTATAITGSTMKTYFPWLEYADSITHVVVDCVMPPNSAYFFCQIAAETIEFGEHFDTSSMECSDQMFSSTKFKRLDLSGWNTEKLTSFKDMFRASCVEYLTMSGWDFSGGTTFGNWAYGNHSLIEINCSGCNFTGLTELPGWNGCTTNEICTIKRIDYSNIIAPDATRFSSEISFSPAISPQNFGSYHSLESITLENAVLTSMTDLTRWFASCYKLTEVNLTGAQFGNITSLESAFLCCNSLVDLSGIIGLSELPLSQNTSMVSMFERCELLEIVDLTGVDTSAVEDVTRMFREDAVLKEVIVSEGAFSSVKNLGCMFYKCTGIEQVDFLSKCDFSSVIWADQMFSYCSSLKETVVFPDMPNVTTFAYTFKDCYALDAVDLTAVTSSSFSASRMFEGCYVLSRLGLPNTGVVFRNVQSMFYNGGWCDYEDDTMASVTFDTTNTFSGWYACKKTVSLAVAYFDKEGNAVDLTCNAEAVFPEEFNVKYPHLYDENFMTIYQQALSTDPNLNREIPFHVSQITKAYDDYDNEGVFRWEVLTKNGYTYTAYNEYTAVPLEVMLEYEEDEDYKNYNNVNDPTTQYINRVPINRDYPYTVAYLARVVAEPVTYRITLDTTYNYTNLKQGYAVDVGDLSNITSVKQEEGATVVVNPILTDDRYIADSWTYGNANRSYVYSDWRGTFLESNSFLMPAYDVSINVLYRQVGFHVLIKQAEHGTASLVDDIGTIYTSSEYGINTTTTLHCVSEDGYRCTGYKVYYADTIEEANGAIAIKTVENVNELQVIYGADYVEDIVVEPIFEEAPLEPSYTVVLPAFIELVPSADGKQLIGEVSVGISYVLPEAEGSITIRMDSTSLSMKNRDNDRLDVIPDRTELVWEADTEGVIQEEDMYIGTGMFYLTSEIKSGQWIGNLVLSIVPDFN